MNGNRSLARAIADGFQWRLLLLWLLTLALPTAMVALPLWRSLAGALDHAPGAADLARRFDFAAMMDAVDAWKAAGDSPASGIVGALVVTLLLSPWLSGLALTAALAGGDRPPGFAALARGGAAWYGRLARLLLWAIVPLGVVAASVGLLRHVVDKRAEHAILEADVDLWRGVVWAIAALLFLLVHLSLEVARARLAIEPERRSVVRAWWRGSVALARRPWSAGVRWLAAGTLGIAVAAALGLLRLHLPPVGAVGDVTAWLTTQLLAATLAWTRCARLAVLLPPPRRI